jgi:hypothetical protein
VNQKSGVVSAFAAKVNFSAFPQQGYSAFVGLGKVLLWPFYKEHGILFSINKKLKRLIV